MATNTENEAKVLPDEAFFDGVPFPPPLALLPLEPESVGEPVFVEKLPEEVSIVPVYGDDRFTVHFLMAPSVDPVKKEPLWITMP